MADVSTSQPAPRTGLSRTVAPNTRARSRRVSRLLRQPTAVAAGAFILLLVIVAAFADVIAPYGFNEQDIPNRLQGPSAQHLLGTDALGRDTLSRLIFGARSVLVTASVPVAIAAVFGTALGLLAGFRRGWWDRILLRAADVGDIIPSLVLALVIMVLVGPGQLAIVIALAAVFLTSYLRLTRALVLAESQKLYVEAAQISGLRESNILFRQILPNIVGPLIALSSIFMGTAILIESSLSFLGLDPSLATWGGMLSDAIQLQRVDPFLPWPPGIAIALSVLAFNLLGDGIRDSLAGERPISQRKIRRLQAAAAASAATPSGNEPSGQAPESDTATGMELRDLRIDVPQASGEPKRLVDGLSLSVRPGEVVGVVGESGSGKSLSALAALGLLPSPVYVSSGSIRVGGQDVLKLNEEGLRRLRGREIGIVFQDPVTSLSPVHTVEQHLTLALRNHSGISRRAARARALELLELVGIRDPETRLNAYPHQLSGGMAQRVCIAMALAGEPRILIADEATTALDMRVQRQILDLIDDLRARLDMGVLLITHDLGLAADMCDRVVVMRNGVVVETGTAAEIFENPSSDYTRSLVDATPSHDSAAPTRRAERIARNEVIAR